MYKKLCRFCLKPLQIKGLNKYGFEIYLCRCKNKNLNKIKKATE